MSQLLTIKPVPQLSGLLEPKRADRKVRPALIKMGEVIRKRMRELDLGVYQLATDLEVPVSTLKTWMTGGSLPSSKNLDKLAKALHINRTNLIAGAE